MKIRIIWTILLFSYQNAFAQFNNLTTSSPSANYPWFLTYSMGYVKLSANNIAHKFHYRAHCSTPTLYKFIGSDSGFHAFGDANQGSSFAFQNPSAFVMNITDSEFYAYNVVATKLRVVLNDTLFDALAHRTNKQECIDCPHTYGWSNSITYPGTYLRTASEYIADTSMILVPKMQHATLAALSANKDSFILYNATPDIFTDTVLQNMLHNIKFNAATLNTAGPSESYSRIFRFSKYSSINSPEPINKAVMLGLKGKTTRYSFGYVDKENDSIRVEHLFWRLGKSRYSTCEFGLQRFPHVSQSTYSRDQVRAFISDTANWTNVLYRNGYSYTQPFGNNAPYTLDAATGDISFTAQDTGIYFLAYRVTEYRDGLPLGDMMTYRIAYIHDSTGITLPTITPPTNVTGATYDAVNKVIGVCAGQPISFNIAASNILAGSKIVLDDNLGISCKGATVTYTGQGGSTPSLTFNWTPTLADAGYHYLYITATDTACGNGHKPVPVTTSFRIIIKTSIDIGVKDSMVCGNRSQPLYLRAGGGQGGVRWYTLPGGDPALSCNQCDVVWVSPDSTTYYVAEMSIGSCIFRDTLKMTVTPLPTVDTIQANPTGAGSFSFSSNARNMATYTWDFGNGGLATVANPTYTYYQNGNYNVRLIVSNFCGQDTAYKTVNVKGVSVNNVPGQNTELKVYPNPADRSVYIQGTSPIESIKVYDIRGVMVNEYRFASKASVEIDVKSYPQGLYLLRIETTDGVVIRKVEVLR